MHPQYRRDLSDLVRSCPFSQTALSLLTESTIGLVVSFTDSTFHFLFNFNSIKEAAMPTGKEGLERTVPSQQKVV